MAALIQELIDKIDNAERVRDQIAAIIAVESANQQALAQLAGKDPALWDLRVFTERSNPWDEFPRELGEESGDRATVPIVNVTFETETFDMATSNIIERQKATGTFNIDCYGYGVSKDSVSGHDPGDARAATESQRAVRLVRNILMSAHYVDLGFTGGDVVWRRWPASITTLQPSSESRPVHHVIATRLALHVEFNEFSPQYQGQPLELISNQVLRTETGQLLLRADF